MNYYNANMASILYILFVFSLIVFGIDSVFGLSKKLQRYVEGDEYE